MTLEIYADKDKVVIEHQAIKRPNYLSPSQWLKFWEDIKFTKGKNVTCWSCGTRQWVG